MAVPHLVARYTWAQTVEAAANCNSQSLAMEEAEVLAVVAIPAVSKWIYLAQTMDHRLRIRHILPAVVVVVVVAVHSRIPGLAVAAETVGHNRCSFEVYCSW